MLKIQDDSGLLIGNFQDIFFKTVEETVEFVFGEYNAVIFYNNLEKNGCNKNDIANNPSLFLNTVHNAFPDFFNMSVPLFLQVIMERLCSKLEVMCDDKKSRHFVEYLAELREAYDQGR